MSSSSEEDDLSSAADARIDYSLLTHMNECPKSLKRDDDDFLTNEDGFACSRYLVKQYVVSVVEFSSQYGSDYSISYTAHNVIGRPTKFPEYGDFPECFAMRTYGNWWNLAPSRVREIQPQNLPKIPAQDFIVVQFETYTFPDEIKIFETFNTGAVVRIWAYTLWKSWVLLWEADRLVAEVELPSSRIFSPTIKKLTVPTKVIKLEFNHTLLNYFTEIDGIMLTGRSVKIDNAMMSNNTHFDANGRIIRRLRDLHFQPIFDGNNQDRLNDFLKNDLKKFKYVATESDTVDGNVKEPPAIGLNDMPFEILLQIFSYLDLITLFRIGRVSHFFYDVSTHPLLYAEINLKPNWHLVSTELITTLAKRATVLRKLDMSWCSQYNKICATEFKKFIQQRGDTLTHLRLNTCSFLNSNCLETLGIVCDNLKELSLRNCASSMPLLKYSCLTNLKNLERLDFFESVIESSLLLSMLESNRKLKHLNLAFCGVGVNMDDVAKQIGKYNHELVSLDMWKSHFLTAIGLRALANCHNLEEVDFGWCLREASLGDSLRVLLTNCTKLKKLFLATVRGITDLDIQGIGNLCPNLEQLDLMGVMGISKERYVELLSKCKKLQLLDLSFCDNIDLHTITTWGRTFEVNIRASHLAFGGRYEYHNHFMFAGT